MTRILNPEYYRAMPLGLGSTTAPIPFDEVEKLLDNGYIQVAMRNGRWWTIRRNGVTQHWKRSPNRIRIPFKAGFNQYGAITESDFIEETQDA